MPQKAEKKVIYSFTTFASEKTMLRKIYRYYNNFYVNLFYCVFSPLHAPQPCECCQGERCLPEHLCSPGAPFASRQCPPCPSATTPWIVEHTPGVRIFLI